MEKMAQPSAGGSSSAASVVSPQYCAANPTELVIVRKMTSLTVGNFEVTDTHDAIMFTVKSPLHSMHGRRVLHDAAGNPILTLRQKGMSAHNRWEAFRGDSTDSSDFLFYTKQTSLFQLKAEIHVFLAHNTKEDVCDFKIKGSWLERSCVVYAGETSTIVAQMHKKYTAESVLIGKDRFMVTVYPNVDYAFIVALIVVLDKINSDY